MKFHQLKLKYFIGDTKLHKTEVFNCGIFIHQPLIFNLKWIGRTAKTNFIHLKANILNINVGMKAEDLRARIPAEDNFVRNSVINRKTVEMLTAKAVAIAAPEVVPVESEAAADAEEVFDAEAEVSQDVDAGADADAGSSDAAAE